MKTVLETLKEVRDIISRGWCQGWDARDETGKMVFHSDKKACSWCLIGAIAKATDNGVGNVVFRSEEENNLFHNCVVQLIETINPDERAGFALTEWNDIRGRKKDEVLSVVDKTIARLELPT